MDGLKRSLEKAIEELRETSPTPPEKSKPAPGSIEAALAGAPAVSPHYVPPPPPHPAPLTDPAQNPATSRPQASRVRDQLDRPIGTPVELPAGLPPVSGNIPPQPGKVVVEPQTIPHAAPELHRDASLPPLPAVPESTPVGVDATSVSLEPPGATKPDMIPEQVAGSPGGRDEAALMSNLLSSLPKEAEKPGSALPRPNWRDKVGVISRVSDRVKGVHGNIKSDRDSYWRWTTIALSCVGGLASGWLGANLSNHGNQGLRTSLQEAINPPSSSRMVAQSDMLSLKGGRRKGAMTGKADRATPMNTDLCTVLELDRGTGLTFAKPCKAVETAEFDSGVSKSDLLANP